MLCVQEWYYQYIHVNIKYEMKYYFIIENSN